MGLIIFIAIYFYLAGRLVFMDIFRYSKSRKKKFDIAIAIGSVVAIIGMVIAKIISYIGDNTSKVRDIAVIIACVCVVIASIATVIILIKKK